MLLLSDGLGHRHPSETRAVVCLILGPGFVLWSNEPSSAPLRRPSFSRGMWHNEEMPTPPPPRRRDRGANREMEHAAWRC
jgi:hypothetical protein